MLKYAKRHLAAACALLALSSGSVMAATVTEDLSFSLSNFLDANGSVAPPLTTLTGSITVTFDPTQGYGADTADLVVHSLSYPNVGSTLAFGYNPSLHVLSFGGVQNNVGQIGFGTNDFVIQFNLTDLAAPKLSLCSDPGFACGNLQGNSTYTSSGYTLAAYPNDFWLALAGTTTPLPTVPEPSSLMLFGVGAAALAFGLRRRA